ncbi:MAG: alpha/beta hydrolase [Burkholderiales bacterium]|nr:alpha/beta hydrolase [Burkholderiales bacterium]
MTETMNEEIKAPNAWLMMLEARAPWELAALGAALPLLRRAPSGDTHPVMVFPGLGASDLSTLPLRNLLDSLGHRTQPWHQGLNFGPRPGVLEQCEADVRETYARLHRRVSLVGWSLGGLYAREVAKRVPELVRCVVTLGTPFAGHPRATNAWKVFEMLSGQDSHDDEQLAPLREPPPVPCTSIYSKTDGVVAWQCSLNPDTELAENVEVQASHIGLGVNPLAIYALTDRLAQPDFRGTRWQKFSPPATLRWLYR